MQTSSQRVLLVGLVWLATALAVAGVAWERTTYANLGWDAIAYQRTIVQVHSGQSPYLTDIETMNRVRAEDKLMASLYTPLTMAFLGWIGSLPVWLYASPYWLLYGAAVLAQLWAIRNCFLPQERYFASMFAPLCILFPGLLYGNVILCGNEAYLMYGIVLAAAIAGWQRERWIWFYLAVLLASCPKPHMLTLLVIPVFSARRQWLASILTGVAGMAIFFSQAWIMSARFSEYLQCMNTFLRNPSCRRDIGFSPMEALSDVLSPLGIRYEIPCLIFYIVYAALILLLLFWFSQQFKRGHLSFMAWTPVMLVGVLLLDPRIKEYDVAAVTLPMALIAWRSLSALTASWKRALFAALFLLLVFNLLNNTIDGIYKYLLLAIFVIVFVSGILLLRREMRLAPNQPMSGRRLVCRMKPATL